MSTLTKMQQQFPAIYKKLSKEQRDLLKILSVIYEHVVLSKVSACLKRAGLRNKDGDFYVNSSLNPVLKALHKKKLITLNSKGAQCKREVAELATRVAVKDGSFEGMAKAVRTEIKAKQPWTFDAYYRSYDQGVRDVRIAIYRGLPMMDVQTILNEVYYQYPGEFMECRPYKRVLCNPLDKEMLFSLDPAIIAAFVSELFGNAMLTLEPVDEMCSFLQEYRTSDLYAQDVCQVCLVLQHIFRGEHEAAQASVEEIQDKAVYQCHTGFLLLVRGEAGKAVTAYRNGLAVMKQTSRKKKVYYTTTAGIFYPLALLQSGSGGDLLEAVSYLKMVRNQKNFYYSEMAEDLLQTAYLLSGKKKKAQELDHSTILLEDIDYLSIYASFLTLFMQGGKLLEGDKDFLISLLNRAEGAGYFWLAREAALLLVRFKGDDVSIAAKLTELNGKCDFAGGLVENVVRHEPWKQVLSSLIDLKAGSQGVVRQSSSRLIWLLSYDEYGEYNITPKLQRLSKNGKWTKGRAVALKTLAKNPDSLDCLSSQDEMVADCIIGDYVGGAGYYGYAKLEYIFDIGKVFKALVGHPLLFWEDRPTVNLELVSGQPELHVEKTDNGFKVSLQPRVDDELGYAIFEETPTRLKLVSLTDEYRRIAEVLDTPIDIPEKAKEMVLDAVAAVAPLLTVHSDIGGAGGSVKEVEADTRLFVHLVPAGEGLKVEFFVKPFRDGGSYYHPGHGGMVVMAEIDSQQLQCQRNLDAERQKVDKVIELCPVLQRQDMVSYGYLLEEPEDCLELLSDMQGLDELLDIQWPQGEKLKVSATLSAAQFSLRIKQDNEWFAASGKLQVDDNMVIDMKKLLEISRLSDSRFVKLDDGQFLALTREFKRRLDEISSFGDNFKEGVRFNPLAALALEDFTTEVGSFKADKHWKNNIKRFEPLDPELPSTLQANLRDYQLEGFKWLACLSHWQVGACLADDMGLGKTVQALAAVLLRAPKGPTLVIAPTSVMMNWQDEAARFAPTLNVRWFGGGDRQQMLDDLDAFDLVVCSYGLLQVEGEKLAAVEWQTVILDEAQAIKNMGTKRSKAAMNLQAQFRIITTGTPIENHLGELWNLYNFVNPGLLGSIDTFNQKFALPIEKFKNKQARNSLKKLIQPFILRRLKQDVLQELPARTEVTMQVEMSAEEAAMYEAQRHLAIEKLEEGDGEKHQQMQILAEITRLRRFCCNPSLVLPKAGIASSKLKVFGQIVDELLQNNHKALVFSQFVGHLDLIKAHLLEKNISFQYLDGSTTVKQRRIRVNDFQAGKGDVFLISLKAGGSGLNLTAADYVIHMDPWWNPAVEDQASDRAHRIGQQRPVTVYRLVVKDTIEEKIVAMHKHKRDLADNLLDGSDMSGRMSTNELLDLLKSS